MSQFYIQGSGGAGPNIITLSDNAGTKVSPDASGNIQLATGPGITDLANAGANKITFSSSGAGFQWNVVTSNTALVKSNGYFTNTISKVMLTLPATASIGDAIWINDVGAGGTWTVVQNAGSPGDQIFLGDTQTTASTGNITSTKIGDSVLLICWRTSGSGNTWSAVAYNGNIMVN